MTRVAQETMQAVAIDRFGGPETLTVRSVPVPEVGPDEVLIRVASAGVGVWDPYERDGSFAEMFGVEPRFPLVLGSEGAGTVVAVGERVRRLREGDRAYAFALMNPKGGAQAEFVVVPAAQASRVPDDLPLDQAGGMPVCAMTALRGLDDALDLDVGESLAVVGASGGVGHLAVQLAKRLGARVLAIASGADGVELCRALGADAAIDGKRDDVAAAARRFAPDGLDAALLTAGGAAAERALAQLRDGGRAAYPNGVEPVPKAREGIVLHAYDGMPDPDAIGRLDRLIAKGLRVHIARRFPLARVAEAQAALDGHFLGKIVLTTDAPE